MKILEDDLFRTTDFACASALLALGFKLELLDRTRSDGRVDFVFRRDPGIDEAIQAHFSGQLKVSSIEYYSAQRNLKSRLKNELQAE